jgi:hypothetical protein
MGMVLTEGSASETKEDREAEAERKHEVGGGGEGGAHCLVVGLVHAGRQLGQQLAARDPGAAAVARLSLDLGMAIGDGCWYEGGSGRGEGEGGRERVL